MTFFVPALYSIIAGVTALLLMFTLIDLITLIFIRKKVTCKRKLEPKLSLGDLQQIKYLLVNESGYRLKCDLVDELPYQLQHRAILGNSILKKYESSEFDFNIFPTERGEYHFGKLYMMLSTSHLGLIKFRKLAENETTLQVYPSILQMKKHAIQIFSKTASSYGIRKVRMVGENDEFEHLRNYVSGDNIKSINWKATSRKNEIIVNQYEDSKSQSIYCLIDKGRAMQMPFEGLSLLDYSINASLVISNIILQKYDKAGLITFSNAISSMVQADNKQIQLQTINEHLYKQTTDFKESNFELLYYTLRQKMNRRGILFLFTNFEQLHEVEDNEYYIKAIAKKHILVIISFINTEILAATKKDCNLKSEVYEKTIAKSLYNEKYKIMSLMQSYGAQVIITTPDKLNINVINKYLEIKAKRMK